VKSGLSSPEGLPADFKSVLDETHQPYGPKASYGYGWNVGVASVTTDVAVPRLSHSGAFVLGASTCVTLLPDQKVGVVVLTNGMPIGVPEALCLAFQLDLFHGYKAPPPFEVLLKQIATALQEELYPAPEPVPPQGPPPSHPLGAYQGVYDHAYFGPIEVVEDSSGGSPVLKMSRAEKGSDAYPLAPRSGDTFTYVPPGENGGGESAVAFEASGSGIDRLQVQHLFESYQAGNEVSYDPRQYANANTDTWTGVYMLDTGAIIPVNGVLRSFKFFAKNGSPVSLVIYTRKGDGVYDVRFQSAPVSPRPEDVNLVYVPGNIEVQKGEVVGFHQPEYGPIAFELLDGKWNLGPGNLSGRVLQTPKGSTSATDFSISSNRVYALSVEIVWGLRGPELATKKTKT
jgi:hypothetical protein